MKPYLQKKSTSTSMSNNLRRPSEAAGLAPWQPLAIASCAGAGPGGTRVPGEHRGGRSLLKMLRMKAAQAAVPTVAFFM